MGRYIVNRSRRDEKKAMTDPRFRYISEELAARSRVLDSWRRPELLVSASAVHEAHCIAQPQCTAQYLRPTPPGICGGGAQSEEQLEAQSTFAIQCPEAVQRYWPGVRLLLLLSG